jgi:putative protease
MSPRQKLKLRSSKKLENRRRIELLAPARDLGTGRVAVDSGADAVYIGGPGFGARRAAGNPIEDIEALVHYARPFGVRVYATLNTLLFDSELTEAEDVARRLVAAGVDALIIQDMAFLRMGLGAVEFHASTQTSNISPEDVAFLGRAGFRRVILERALSIDEIREIRAAASEELELEAFIHGALCVGFSGRCFMSLASGGGRSGNRGDCSQPCRLACDLVDEAGGVVIKGKHLLSLRDLDLSARIGELLDAGVASFKIEGRLKDAAYVRNVVSHYRAIIDRELASRPGLVRASVGRATPDFTPDPAKSFTRGASEYFFESASRLPSQAATSHRKMDGGRPSANPNETVDGLNKNPQGIASFDTPKAIGEPFGRVERVDCERTGNRFFTLSPAAVDLSAGDGGNGHSELSAGDGICFFVNGGLRGTSINRIEGRRIYPNDADGITPGVEIFRNHNHAFTRALERSRMKRRITVSANVATTPAQVEVTFTDESGVAVTVTRIGEFDPAQNPDKMAATVREQLARSGDTIFEVSRIEAPGEMFVPVSTLAQMRREGLERLLEARNKLAPVRNPASENPEARAPKTRLEPEDNVTNHLAENFWRDHGVTEIEPAMETRGPATGDTVMRSRYCIRREIGQCLKNGPKIGGDLFLERGTTRWRLEFDCAKCVMEIKKI